MIRQARPARRLPLRLLALAAAMSCAGGTWAQDRPYYLGASLGVTHESNVFRSTTNEQSDNITSVGLLGGIDAQLGRQRVYARGSINHNKHDISMLDNVSYALGAGLDWQTIERLSGSLSVGASQRLANDTAPDLQPIVVNRKNIENANQAAARIRYGIAASLAIEAGYTHRRVDYSTVDYIVRENTQDQASIGLRWSRSDLLSLGVGLRYTDIERPNALIAAPNIIGPQDSERRDIDFTAVWKPTGRSTLNGRVSLTEQDYSTPATPDLSGVTGSLIWSFNPGGRLSFDASVMRDTGTETTFFQFAPDENPVSVDNSRISTQLGLLARYELTAKTSFNARLRHRESSYATSSGDSFDSYALGVNWSPTRAITVGCNATRESRGSAYDADVFGCFGQFVLR
jgi:hypothetical protein